MDYLPKLTRLPLVETLLEAFALDREYVPREMRKIVEANELPLALRRIARRYQKASLAWCAWADEQRMLFVTARMLSEQCERPVLRIRFYDKDGRLMSAAAWKATRAGGWELCAVGPLAGGTK